MPSRVYSALDADVMPPSPLRPQKLDLARAAGAADQGMIEFVVDASGTVEAAKATRSPRTLADSLFLTTALHAVKSWRFSPALKDGSPVASRQLVAVRGNTVAEQATVSQD